MSFVNFAALQSQTTIGNTDQFLISLDNGLSGASGFGRATTGAVERSLGIYTTVQSNSAQWATDNTADAEVRALSANWQSTYTTMSSSSGSWTQTLTFNSDNAQLTISGGNTTSLSALSAASSSSLPASGTTGQILVKNSAANNDASWQNKRTTLTLATLSTTGTISCNALSADQFVVSLSGIALSATIGAPSNAYDAQIIMWNLRYTTNVARVLLDSSFRTPITTLNWTISANRMDIIAAKYNALDSKWDVISFAPGYII